MSNIIRFDRSSASETNNEQSEPEPSDPEPSGLRLVPTIEQASSTEFEKPSQAEIAAIVDAVKSVTDAHTEKKTAKGKRYIFRREATVAAPDMPEAVVELNQYGFFDPGNDAARDYYERNPDPKVADVTFRASKAALRESQTEGLRQENYRVEKSDDGDLELIFCRMSDEYEGRRQKVYSPVSKEDAVTLLALLESL